jgi:hypothetical protein
MKNLTFRNRKNPRIPMEAQKIPNNQHNPEQKEQC